MDNKIMVGSRIFFNQILKLQKGKKVCVTKTLTRPHVKESWIFCVYSLYRMHRIFQLFERFHIEIVKLKIKSSYTHLAINPLSLVARRALYRLVSTFVKARQTMRQGNKISMKSVIMVDSCSDTV